jgi:hypothetical protein
MRIKELADSFLAGFPFTALENAGPEQSPAPYLPAYFSPTNPRTFR